MKMIEQTNNQEGVVGNDARVRSDNCCRLYKSDKLANLLVFLSMYGKMAVGGRS